MKYGLSLFFVITFWILNLFDLSFVILFCKTFQKCIFPLRSYVTYVLGTVYSSFFNYKNLFGPIWRVNSRKNVFIFWYSHMFTNFKLRIFCIIFYTKVNIFPWLYINTLFLMVLFALLYSLTKSDNLSMYTIFSIEPIYL